MLLKIRLKEDWNGYKAGTEQVVIESTYRELKKNGLCNLVSGGLDDFIPIIPKHEEEE